MENKYNLPQAIVDAVMHDEYDRGGADISVTGLISPPRLEALKEQYKGDERLVEDVSENLWRLFGKSIHNILAMAGHDQLAEERLYARVCSKHGLATDDCSEHRGCLESGGFWLISGAFDSLTLDDDGEGWRLTDWKTTSVWTAVFKDRFEEWEAQLNLYALLLHHQGFEITSLQVGGFWRDWRRGEAQRGGDYPPIAFSTIPLNVWPLARQEAYLMERVRLHQEARVELPDCSPEERWMKPDAWAIMKHGRKSAVRVLDSTDAAIAYGLTHGIADLQTIPNTDERESIDVWAKDYYLDFRPGVSTRCAEFCPVRHICSWGVAEQRSTLERQLEASVGPAGGGG